VWSRGTKLLFHETEFVAIRIPIDHCSVGLEVSGDTLALANLNGLTPQRDLLGTGSDSSTTKEAGRRSHAFNLSMWTTFAAMLRELYHTVDWGYYLHTKYGPDRGAPFGERPLNRLGRSTKPSFLW